MNIDLTHHAVVEASAGTGKTHTIQELVLRLLVEANAHIEQILVVTFTEKATGELRDRIRGALEKKLTEAPEHRDVWHRALDSFDQAPIFTLHGFCHRLLREYALEQGLDFHGTLVDTGELIEPCLRDVQRKNWRQDYGPRLGAVLNQAGYDRSSADKWEGRVRAVAARFRPECGHRILPEVPADGIDTAKMEQVFRTKIEHVRTLAGMPGAAAEDHPWISAFSTCRMHASSRRVRAEDYLPWLLAWLKNEANLHEPLASFLAITERLGDRFPENPRVFETIYHKHEGEDRDEINAACTGLAEAVAILEELRVLSKMRAMPEELAVRTIHQLHECMSQYKRERGLYTFDDLIVEAAAALDPKKPGAAAFVQALRDRFRYAIVDEFQDTDPLQWVILRRIFLESPKGANLPQRLFVVGDPKQAIFGFRGADLPTYLRATNEMKEAFAAKATTLGVNWRSSPQILTALNRLFGAGDWFKSEFPYQDVQAPPAGAHTTAIDPDPTGRPALSLVNWRHCDTPGKCRARHAEFIGREARRLIDGRVEITIKGQRRPLEAGDMAALVFRRNEAIPLIRALKENNIPYTFFKQPGLWESQEAEQLALVLKAVARPDDRAAWRKALLTKFFQIKPNEITMCAEIPSHHPARKLMQCWIAAAERRDWSALCQSILEDTGVLFREKEKPDFDRRLANYRFLLGELQERGYRENLDLLDLVEQLGAGKSATPEAEADTQPIETENPKFKIMTIHASKGLEFPVVFLAGGFTSRGNNATYLTYRDDEQHEVFDLAPEGYTKHRAEDQDTANDRRLLYVALTRAMLKLYVPLVKSDQKPLYWQGPIYKVLHKAQKGAGLLDLGHPLAADVNGADFPPIKTQTATRPLPGAGAAAEAPLKPEFPTVPADLRRRRLTVLSFSSLQRAEARLHEGPTFGLQTPRADDEDAGADAPDDPLRGPVFGEIVHQVLEEIDFAEVGAAAEAGVLLSNASLRRNIEGPVARQVAKIRARLPRQQLEDACRKKVAELVWQALATPLPGLDSSMGKIPSSDRISELEFQYFLTSTQLASGAGGESFVTGFMDLVFRKDGRLYLLDWKTNLLDSYDKPALEEAMDESGYRRQYRLYLRALAKWLAARQGSEFDFAKSIGGVYYLFLRGMNGRPDSPGVYHHVPTAGELALPM